MIVIKIAIRYQCYRVVFKYFRVFLLKLSEVLLYVGIFLFLVGPPIVYILITDANMLGFYNSNIVFILCVYKYFNYNAYINNITKTKIILPRKTNCSFLVIYFLSVCGQPNIYTFKQVNNITVHRSSVCVFVPQIISDATKVYGRHKHHV